MSEDRDARSPEAPPVDDAPPASPSAASPPAGVAPSSGMGAPGGAPTSTAGTPIYKGEPLDADRGPGLGCFWIQVALLVVFLVLTPLTVVWAWDPLVSGILLILTLILLFFAGQTSIFLLRLVAADRRTRRRPLDPKAKQTVGQMEDDAADRAKREDTD